MATKFLEPGGDADFAVAGTNGFWTLGTTFPTVATDFVHGNHVNSIKYAVNGTNNIKTPSGTLADAGTRISLWVYINALPNALESFILITPTIFRLRMTTGGVLQLWNGTVGQIGSNGATLSTGQWYRISIAYTITSTTINRIELFVDGVSSISITNATIGGTGSSILQLGNAVADTLFDWRSSDHYIDNSSALTDPGNIWVTAKRPNANGTAVEFTTQIGAGGSGYGSGHSPQVNERALSTTNGWSLSTTTRKTEEYSIESISQGDIDITGATIIDFMGWISASVDSTANSPVHRIIVSGTTTAKTMTTSARVYTQMAASSTYPTGNTDIGMDAQYTTTPHLTRLFECGIIVAYIPSSTSIKSINGLAIASVKSVNGLAIASVKNYNGLA